jgi:hypothetical protein
MKINITKTPLNPSRDKDEPRKNLHIEQAKTEWKSRNKTSLGANNNPP